MRLIDHIKKEKAVVLYYVQDTFVWKYYGIMLFLIVLSVVTNLFFSYGFSEVLSENRQISEMTGLVLQAFAAGRISYTVCRFLYSKISLQFKIRLKEAYMNQITQRLLQADYGWVLKQQGGDLVGKSCEDVDCSAKAVAEYIPKLFKSAGLLIFNTLFLGSFHPLLGAAFAFPLPFLFFSEWRGREICQRFLKSSTAVLSERNSVFQDIVSHHDLVAHCAVQEEMLARTEDVCERYAERFGKAMGALVGWMSPAILLNKAPLILTGVLGGVLVSQGKISASAFLTAFLFTYIFNSELAELDDFMANFPTLEVFLERVKGILDCPVQREGGCTVVPENVDTIRFEDVSFRYDSSPEDSYLLEGLSFSVGQGEHVLFRGGNGSGKTTVLKLINGLYRVQEGNVLLYGCPPEAYALSWLRHLTAYVPSEPVLWEGTIRENLLAGKENSDDALVKVLENFDFHAAFPGREDQEILNLPVEWKGENLSGGQRQRIGLARGWLSGASVLLIDEATNSLDHEGEDRIIRFLCGSDRTVCMTTHHRELSKYFDKEIYMDNKKESLGKEPGHERI